MPKSLQRLELLAKTADLLCRKYSPSDISLAMQISLPLAKSLVREVETEWRKTHTDTIETSRNRVLAEERHLRKAYWNHLESEAAKNKPVHSLLAGIGTSLARERELLGLDTPQKITTPELDGAISAILKELAGMIPQTVSGEILQLLPGEEFDRIQLVEDEIRLQNLVGTAESEAPLDKVEEEVPRTSESSDQS